MNKLCISINKIKKTEIYYKEKKIIKKYIFTKKNC